MKAASIDYSTLRSFEQREGFYEDVLVDPGGEHAIEPLVGYYDYLTSGLVDSGVADDETEARTMAAQGVMSGLRKAVASRTSRHGVVCQTIDALDTFIRHFHGLEQRRDYLPVDHSDPLVAAFYQELSPHLLRSTDQGPTSPWTNY